MRLVGRMKVEGDTKRPDSVGARARMKVTGLQLPEQRSFPDDTICTVRAYMVM